LPFFDDVVAAFCSPPKAYTKDSDRSRVALGDIAFPVAVANLVAAIAIWFHFRQPQIAGGRSSAEVACCYLRVFWAISR
jgi:hypothetical protein